MTITLWPRKPRGTLISDLLAKHFLKAKPESLCISERKFPYRVRADLQRGMDQVIASEKGLVQFCGIVQGFSIEGIEISSLMSQHDGRPSVVVPPQYEDVDIGEDQPVRCLKSGLWLMNSGTDRYAILLSPAREHGRVLGMRIQIATFQGEAGVRIVDRIFQSLEKSVNSFPSYRGKILSLESNESYSGQSSGIKVHKLRTVQREQVILPAKTLALLERNVIQFVEQRKKLVELKQTTKKGLLFYGPPGTGKSHTIHYLASALQGHTVLLITAEQTNALADYMVLARLLQPSIVVIEDVDLIARQRSAMGNSNERSLLNKLLNEMDGLKEDAEILFILTTNQPSELEAALSSRPGRVDQAIEFPLPDKTGREKLVRLYAGVPISDDLVEMIVKKTENVSAAFIKELMRRSVQFQLARKDEQSITARDIENALDEMLFSGGALNIKLLGGTKPVGFAAEASS